MYSVGHRRGGCSASTLLPGVSGCGDDSLAPDGLAPQWLDAED